VFEWRVLVRGRRHRGAGGDHRLWPPDHLLTRFCREGDRDHPCRTSPGKYPLEHSHPGQEVGASHSIVHRIWRQRRLQSNRTPTFKVQR